MAKLILNPEHQIQRLNSILNKVHSLEKQPYGNLTKAPPKSWNVVQVLQHLTITTRAYDTKIATALEQTAAASSESWSFKTRPWQRFVIQGQRPKGKKRPFKIKTLKRFEPSVPPSEITPEKIDAIFDDFKSTYTQLKSNIVKSRSRQMKHPTFSSAIGPLVKFYLPEAFEFLLCHSERHMVQIDEILNA